MSFIEVVLKQMCTYYSRYFTYHQTVFVFFLHCGITSILKRLLSFCAVLSILKLIVEPSLVFHDYLQLVGCVYLFTCSFLCSPKGEAYCRRFLRRSVRPPVRYLFRKITLKLMLAFE